MKNSDIIYTLNIVDIQTVANGELRRDLTDNEIELIKESIAERIGWYDAIADSINEKIN
jgi:hypothetical protein